MPVHQHLAYYTWKQTNLTNSLLHDIAVSNEYDSTKLEDWLIDIETAVDLTSECWAKLAKAKLRRLTCTLVMGAINSVESWEGIKGFIYALNYITLTFIPIPHISWISNNGKRNLLPPMSIGSRQRTTEMQLHKWCPYHQNLCQRIEEYP